MMQVTALMDMLDGKLFENRVEAWRRAMRFLATTRPEGAGFFRSFPFMDRAQMIRFFSDNGTCPHADCRIDVEVDAGVAFEPYL